MTSNRIILFLLTIVLYFFSFPPFFTGFFSYFVLIPFFFILEKDLFKSGFRTGYLLGLFSIGSFIYWMNWNSGATQIQATGMYLGTITYLSLLWGIFGFVQNFVCQKFGTKGFVFAPFLWTSLEYLQSMGELGFTWHLFPTTQTYYTPLIQYIEFTGINGITFWVVLINVIIYFIIKKVRSNDVSIPWSMHRLVMVLLLLFFIPLFYGFIVLNSQKYSGGKRIQAAIIQPNIEPNRKWLEKDFAYAEIMRLTHEAKEKNADVILWPETAIPTRLRVDKTKFDDIRSELRRQWTTLITGIPDRKTTMNVDGKPRSHYYNSIYMIRPDRSGFVSYDKTHLVPFGEFVPSFLFFMKEMAMDVGIPDYYAGDSISVFTLPLFNDTLQADSVKVLAVVCLESIFPQLVREGVQKGARILAIVTNDAWYDGTYAPIQHSQIAVLRAIENRLSVLRCANSGVSAIIDPYGNVLAQTQNGTQEILAGSVSIQPQETFFTCNGNVFSIFISILTFILLLVLIILRLRSFRSHPA
ncbi:apolipoprotein N-acyltransferase [bacterium]|nr:MAG: apolipoprotein N-acyltransferase [bacterium]